MELPSHIKKRKRRPTLCIQLISKIEGTVKTQTSDSGKIDFKYVPSEN
jgi:hypothetical protein